MLQVHLEIMTELHSDHSSQAVSRERWRAGVAGHLAEYQRLHFAETLHNTQRMKKYRHTPPYASLFAPKKSTPSQPEINSIDMFQQIAHPRNLSRYPVLMFHPDTIRTLIQNSASRCFTKINYEPHIPFNFFLFR